MLIEDVQASANQLIRSAVELNFPNLPNDPKQIKSFITDSSWILSDPYLLVEASFWDQQPQRFSFPLTHGDCDKLIQYDDKEYKLLNQAKPQSLVHEIIAKDYRHKLLPSARHCLKFSTYNNISQTNIKSETKPLNLICSMNNPQLELIRQTLFPQAAQIFASIYKLVIEGAAANTNHDPTADISNNILLTHYADQDNHRSNLFTRCCGSLIVFFPTETGYEGGDSALFHDDEKQATFQFHNRPTTKKNDLTVQAELLAFGLGCSYAVKPVTTGYKVSLFYNIFWDLPEENKEKITTLQLQIYLEKCLLQDLLPRDIIKIITAYAMFDPIMSIVQHPSLDPNSTCYLLYALDYHYPKSGVTLSDLRGRDKLILHYLSNFVSVDKLDLVYCTFTISEEYPEEEGWQSPVEYFQHLVSGGWEAPCNGKYRVASAADAEEKVESIRNIQFFSNDFDTTRGLPKSIVMVTYHGFGVYDKSLVIHQWADTALCLISEKCSDHSFWPNDNDSEEDDPQQYFQLRYQGTALRINVQGLYHKK